MSQSITLPCPGCGAALPVEPTASSATCGYCRAVAPIPEEIRRQALAYAARVGAAHGKVEEGRSALQVYRRSAVWQKEWWKLVVALFGSMLGVSLLASLLRGRAGISWLGPIVVYGALGYVGFRIYRKAKRGQQDGGESPAVAASVCQRCGGPLTFQAGSAATVCRSCSATAVAGKTIQAELASATEKHARDLDIERGRAERQMYRAMAPSQQFTRYYVIVAGGWPVAALVLVGLIGGVVQLVSGLARGNPRDVRQGIVLLILGGLAGSVVAIAATIFYRVVIAPARAAGRTLHAFARLSGGRITEGGVTSALDWLEANWQGPAPFEVMMQQQEVRRWTLSTTIDGMAALLVVFRGGTTTGQRMHVLVSAPKERGTVSGSERAAELEKLGFEVKPSYDGIALGRAHADDTVLTTEMLQWILRAGAALARG